MKISLNIEVRMKDGVLILTDTEGKAVTFLKDQLVQKKVSMVTLGELSDLPRIKVAQVLGFATRKSCYDAEGARRVLDMPFSTGWPLICFPREPGRKRLKREPVNLKSGLSKCVSIQLTTCTK